MFCNNLGRANETSYRIRCSFFFLALLLFFVILDYSGQKKE
ncbi:UNVERIFIED_ORG: putative membrane protein [Clostridioides difficile Y384]